MVPARRAAIALQRMQFMLTRALGLSTMVFGLFSIVAPAPFAKLFGIGGSDDPTVATALRSVGIRDAMIGVGLVRALQTGNPDTVGPWLLARAASDTGDAIAVGVAVAAGARNPRFLLLGCMAVGAAAVGGMLLWAEDRRRSN